MTNEASYQRNLIHKLERLFPGCLVIKNDPQFTQGIPDLLILFEDRWGMLEVKKSETAKVQPNQAHYVQHYGEMSFAAFICPENEDEVLNELQSALRPGRQARLLES